MVTRTCRGRDAGTRPNSRRYRAVLSRRTPNGPFAGYQLAPSRCSYPARRDRIAAPTTTCARKAEALIPQLRDKRFWRAGDITLSFMNTGVELHDSDVAEVTSVGRELRLVFRPGYVHESEGIPGTDPGWGYLQPVEFIFSEATFSENGLCRGTVLGGAIRTSNVKYSNLVPLPLAASGPISAEFEFNSGGVLKVSAHAFTCGAIGERDPKFQERYEG
jgi:hypothetical protein